MPGIYLHIPFCKQACHYCNFHFSTSLRAKPALVDALLRELELQRDYLQGAELTSIYFGGGTPSLLSLAELDRLLGTIFRLHRVDPGAEITLEGNPDDLSREYLADLRRHTAVNRLSIGIQSFHDEDLRWMNRAHSAAHAYACLENARAEAFDDLTIDLIYGSPTTTDERWRHNLDLAFDMDIPHLSCYSLTVEPGTALGHFVKKGRVAPMDDEQAARQFEYLMDAATARGYEHYEISNFARPGRYARHNSSYWRGEAYLGIGPSAHSFDGQARRQWNVANNAAYVRALEAGAIPAESESLTAGQRYNEYVLTALRTVWGCETARLQALGEPFRRYFEQRVGAFVDSGWVERREGVYRLTRSGKLMADFITTDLFFNE